MIPRTYWSCPTLDSPRTDEEGGSFEERFDETSRYRATTEHEANLVGSMIDGASPDVTDPSHAPVLDLDIPARLVPSTSPGHSHLYLDVVMPWSKYKALLLALEAAGILEPGYVSASIRRGQTFVRKPGVVKPSDAPSS